MKTLILFAALLTMTVFTSCSKQKSISCDGETLTLTDLTGLDGCGWVLEGNNQRFEPVNLSDFNLTLEEGQRYCVEYTELTDRASICMVGPIIEIKTINLLD